MARPPKRSSRSWRLPTTQRRDLYVARYLSGFVDLLEAHARAGGADTTDPEWRDRLEEYAAAGLGDAFDEGAVPVADTASALDVERNLRRRMESILRSHGLPVPTDRRPSEPPPES